MDEKQGHRILNNSFRALGGFSEKIHDQPFNPSIRFTPKKPFDGMSVFKDTAYFWEMKYAKGLQALNIKKLADHQREALENIARNSHDDIYSLVVYFVYEPRKRKEFYFIWSVYLEIVESISKKQFLEFKKQGFAYPIRKIDKNDICNLLDIKIIGVDNETT
jgi:penicillin-binding protein-related factor A (putative recombinase)